MTKFATHDDYINAAPQALQPLLIELRGALREALPDAEELIKYDMPGFGTGKTVIAGYAAFSKQCGLYVHKDAILIHSDDIVAAGLKASKTGVTFSPSKPLSKALITQLAIASRKAFNL